MASCRHSNELSDQVWTDFALWAKRLPGSEHLSILRRACRSLGLSGSSGVHGEYHGFSIVSLGLWFTIVRVVKIYNRTDNLHKILSTDGDPPYAKLAVS